MKPAVEIKTVDQLVNWIGAQLSQEDRAKISCNGADYIQVRDVVDKYLYYVPSVFEPASPLMSDAAATYSLKHPDDVTRLVVNWVWSFVPRDSFSPKAYAKRISKGRRDSQKGAVASDPVPDKPTVHKASEAASDVFAREVIGGIREIQVGDMPHLVGGSGCPGGLAVCVGHSSACGEYNYMILSEPSSGLFRKHCVVSAKKFGVTRIIGSTSDREYHLLMAGEEVPLTCRQRTVGFDVRFQITGVGKTRINGVTERQSAKEAVEATSANALWQHVSSNSVIVKILSATSIGAGSK